MTFEETEKALLDAYDEIIKSRGNEPDWAVHQRNDQSKLVSCTIPFVGKHYNEQPVKILVYASAESLSDYYPGGGERPWLDDDTIAANRHRFFFENNKTDDWRFPNVHIGPLNTGCLLTAVMYIAFKLKGADDITPSEFYETISFGNYGKYTKESKMQTNLRLYGSETGSATNFDYPTKEPALLEYSHDFIAKDFKLLKPDYVIMPESIYRNDKAFIDSIKGNAKIIGIYQMIPVNIHKHIPNRVAKKGLPGYKPEDLPDNIQKIVGNITHANHDKYLYVFNYLDETIDNSTK